jgi:DNA-directed RNA polymerase specialized sigma24 family protein
MSGQGSVTVWLDRLRAGEGRDEAVARLWEKYFARLVAQARNHLRGRRSLAEGEDVALSAFDGFVRSVELGKFPKLDGRDDLWRILLRMTANRASNAVRDENRDRRGGRLSRAEPLDGSDPPGVPVAASDPDPAEAVALAEGVERMLAALGSEELRRVAVMSLEGYNNAEIAAAIGKVEPTVERKRRRIREIWGAMGFDPGEA